MRYFLPWSAARGAQLLGRLRRRLDNSECLTALSSTVFDLAEWSSMNPAPNETVERAATLIRLFAESFEKLSPAADRVLAGDEENVPCYPTARPLWVAVSEAAGMAEELRELTRNPPPPLNDVPEWLERAMDAAIAKVSTKH